LFIVGFAGLAALSALVAIAYPVFVVWMIVDGVLRADAEYPGVQANRKVLWVVLMVLVHPVAVVYFFMVFNRVKRGSLASCPGPAPVV
jgi:hypothetical protein